MRTIAVFVLSLWSIVCVAQAPPRDTTERPATGTALIRGHAFDASNGTPLRKVEVRLFSSGRTGDTRLAITDNGGAYEFKNVPAGRYQMRASKNGFLTLQYGQTRPWSTGKPLEVLNAQQLEKIDFSLPHGAVVTGHVVDDAGEPLADVDVSVLQSSYIDGRRQLGVSGESRTNDIGEYRIAGLPPAQYFVSAIQRGLSQNDISENRRGYATTYFPGTSNVAEAQRLTLATGQTLADINIALVETRLARVSGTAVDSNGRPITNASVMLLQWLLGGGASNRLRPDGSFAIDRVPPGEYTVRLLYPASTGDDEEVQATITVAGEDIADLRLVSVRRSTITGRIVPPPSQSPNVNLSALRLIALPTRVGIIASGGAGRVNDDGTFEISIEPGITRIGMSAEGTFANTRIKAVRVNGVDVVDTGLDVRANEDIKGVEIELTNQLGSIEGVATDARGNIVKDYTVLIFPRDRERRGPGSRYFSEGGRPDQDGRYKATNLFAGDYYAIAVEAIEPGVNTDPEFLEKARERATEFSVAEGEAKRLDLKLVATP